MSRGGFLGKFMGGKTSPPSRETEKNVSQKANKNKGESERTHPHDTQKGRKAVPKTTSAVNQNQNEKKPNMAKKVQFAARPANSSGLSVKKEHPQVHFGPDLKEFLNSKELANQEVSFTYYRKNDSSDLVLTFSKVQENGVSISKPVSLKYEEYLTQKQKLLGIKDDQSHYMGFVERLINRLGIDISQAKPSVQLKSVEKFVSRHLSPMEKIIVSLSEDEYNKIDTGKVPKVLEPTNNVVEKYFGGPVGRQVHLVKCINSDGDQIDDKPPPNWAEYGVLGTSKGYFLEAVKLVATVNITEEQKKALSHLRLDLFGEPNEQGGEHDEEEKTFLKKE